MFEICRQDVRLYVPACLFAYHKDILVMRMILVINNRVKCQGIV